MKKLLLLASLAAPILAVLAQGEVNFSTRVTAKGTIAPVRDVDGTALLAGTCLWTQLYWSPSGAEGSFTPAGTPINFRTGLLKGYVSGNTVTIPVTPGTAVWIQQRAWTEPFATCEAAVEGSCGRYGFGNTIRVVTTSGILDPPADLAGLQGFMLGFPELFFMNPPPRLLISRDGNCVVLSWPMSTCWECPGWAVETSPALAGVSWGPLGVQPDLTNGQYTATVPASSAAQLFRLRWP